MRQATQRYRQVYEKYFHSIATKCTSVNDLYRLLAVLGLNPTAAQIKSIWKTASANEFGFDDFVECAEKLKDTGSKQYSDELKRALTDKFGKSLKRDEISRLVTSSSSNMSAGRLDQFLGDTFGDEQTLSTELFMQKFSALKKDSFDFFVNDKAKVSAKDDEDNQPEFKVSFSDLKNTDLSDHVIDEATCSARGAFFVTDRAGHRFKMTLSTASRCRINLSMDTSETVLTFFIVRNGHIEGVGQLMPSHEYISAVWQGDLPAGSYTVIPCPVTLPKRERPSGQWLDLSTKDQYGEIRLTQDCKNALAKVLALFDTSGNGRLGKEEFLEFVKRTEPEGVKEFDELWETIKINFNTIKDEVTLNGLLAIHESQIAESSDQELYELFTNLGFTSDLSPLGCASIKLDIETPESISKVEGLPIDQFANDGLTHVIKSSVKQNAANLPSSIEAKLFQIDSFAVLILAASRTHRISASVRASNVLPEHPEAMKILLRPSRPDLIVFARNNPLKISEAALRIRQVQST